MTTTRGYELHPGAHRVPIKAWTRGVPVEDVAMQQLLNTASLPIIHGHLAVMPDVHWGMGATIGSVIPTKDAVIPAAVGVDIGCGMMAVRTSLTASDLPDNLGRVRSAIEAAVPHGRDHNGGKGDTGAWSDVPDHVASVWAGFEPGFKRIVDKHPKVERSNNVVHLGTLGTGNHFVEVCLDEADRVWFMLHSGSRGVGGRIGSLFVALAKKDMEGHLGQLPDKNLAYLSEGNQHFDDYMEAVGWAQEFALASREIMMKAAIDAVRASGMRPFVLDMHAINCHHNYVSRETHNGEQILVTRKGAVSAQDGQLGIIPGSMGTRSYIVRGKGNPDSYCSCSHGAGRVMSRTEAKRTFTLEDHARATDGVECRKDADVLDETPGAYKDIDQVMAAQQDLVEVVHTLKQVVCVKG